MKIKIKKLYPNVQLPVRAYPTDTGLDLYAHNYSYDGELEIHTYGTGIAAQAPEGFGLFVVPRSSIYRMDLTLANSIGVIDATYTGEICVKFRSATYYQKVYQVGDRIAQLICLPIGIFDTVEVMDLGKTERGAGGFGSTGLNSFGEGPTNE
jgi:dUTP pyrophosphatase